MQQTKSRTQGL